MKKKLMALFLAMVMVMGLSVTAFADETGTGTDDEKTYNDMSTVTITKVYTAINDGTTSPAETFTVTQVGDGRVVDGDATSAPALGAITGAAFIEGAATTTGATASITITLPTYEKVGIYEYTLREVAGTTAGVTYFNGDITLRVTVIEQDGQVRVAAVHTETKEEGADWDPNSKTDRIENTYSAGSLSISKTVTGNLGDKSKYFKVTVTLTGEEGKTYATSYAVTGGSYTENPTSIEIGTATDFYLKDGDTITIENLPYGVTYTVVEADYTESDGYDAADYTFSDEDKKIDSESDTVKITNNKDTSVDTGITMDSLPYIVLLALVVVAGVVFFSKKRMAREN